MTHHKKFFTEKNLQISTGTNFNTNYELSPSEIY